MIRLPCQCTYHQSSLATHPVIARGTATRRRQRPTRRQNRVSHPATATRPHHTRRQQALWGRPSRSKLPAHPVIARATVTRSTPRTRQLRKPQPPTSRQNRASHPGTATQSTLHTRPRQVWERPSRSRRAAHPVIARGTVTRRLRSPPPRTYRRPPSRLNLRPGQRAPTRNRHSISRTKMSLPAPSKSLS